MADITGGKLNYVVTVDTSQLEKSLKDAEGKLLGFSEIAEQTGIKLDGVVSADVLDKLKDLGKTSKLTGKELKDAISDAEQFVKGMEQGLNEALRLNEKLAKELTGMADGPERTAMIEEWKTFNSELEDTSVTIEKLKKFVADVKYEAVPLQTQFNRAKEEMEQLVLIGEKGGAKYKALSEEAAKLKKSMEDVSRELKIVTDPSGMQGFISTLATASSGASTLAGIYGLLGTESEKLKEVTDKINSVMAIAVGLQGIASQGAQAYTAVTNTLTAAQGRLATALGISTTAARVLMGVLSLGITTAITGLIWAYQKYSAEMQKSTKAKRALSEASREGAANASSEITKLQILYATATDVTRSIDERKNAVKSLQKEWKPYFGNINSEIIMNGKAEKSYLAVRDAIIAASKARAAQSKLDKMNEKFLEDDEEFRQKIKKVGERRNNAKNSSVTVGQGYGLKTVIVSAAEERAAANREIDRLIKEWTAAKIQQKKDIAPLMKFILDAQEKTLIPPPPKKGTQDWYSAEIEKLREANKKLKPESKEWKKNFEKIKEYQEIINPKEPKVKSRKSESSSLPEEVFLAGSLADLRDKLQEVEDAFAKTNSEITRDSLNQQRVDLQNQIKAIEDKYKVVEQGLSEEEALRLKNLEEQKKRFDQLLQSQRTYEERALDLTKEYEAMKQSEFYKTASESDKAKIDQGFKDELSAITAEMFKNSDAWIEAFGSMENKSKEYLQKILASLQAFKNSPEFNNLLPKDLEAFNRAESRVNIAIASKNPFTAVIKGLKEYKKASDDASRSEALIAIGNGLSEAQRKFNEVGGAVLEFSDTFGGLDNAASAAIDNLMNIGNAAFELGKAISSGDVSSMISTGIKLISSIGAALSGDGAKERAIKNWTEEIRKLEQAYIDLERVASKALGEHAISASKATIANLQQQKALLAQMARKEADKKKSDKNKVKEYKDAMADIDRTIEDIQDSLVDKVMNGLDAKSLADKLGDAIADAVGRGEDSLESLGKTADEVFRDMVKNALKMKLLEQPMQDIVDKMLASMGFKKTKDGLTGTFDGLTDDERSNIKNMIQAASQNYTNALKEYEDLFANTSTEAQGLKGDIKGITERTAGALEAQINASRIIAVEQLEISRRNYNTVIASVQILSQIASNTSNLIQIRKDISELNSKTNPNLAGL